MNPNKPSPPPDDFESKITALLLGELAPDEARAVEQAIAADTTLTALRDRLRTILPLVRQAVVGPEASAGSSANAPRLSAERRDSLLRHFKTIVPRWFDLPRSRWQSWLIPMTAAAVLIVMASLVLPSLAKAKAKSQGQSLAYRHDAPPASLVTRLGREPADVRWDAQYQIDPVAGMPMSGEPGGSTETRERLVQAVQTGPNSSQEGVEAAAKAESSSAEPARPMMDIRMLMRYGLLPKGMKTLEEAGESAAASGPAKAAEERKADVASLGQRILARQQPQAGAPVPSASSQSELAPLPLELPAPAFMGTPTHGLAFADSDAKSKATEIRDGEESAQAMTRGETLANYGDIQQNRHFDAVAEGAHVDGFALAESRRMGGGGMGGMGMMGGMGGVGGAGESDSDSAGATEVAQRLSKSDHAGGVPKPASSSDAKASPNRYAAGYYAYGLPAQKVAEEAKIPVLGDVPLVGADFGLLKVEPESLERVAAAANAPAREPQPLGLLTPGAGKPVDSSVRRGAAGSGEQRGRAWVAESSLAPTRQLADKEQGVDRLAESEAGLADLRLRVAGVNGEAGLQPQAPAVAASVVAAPESGARASGLMTNAVASVDALEANGRVAGDLVVQEVAKKAINRPSAPPPEPQPEVATAANPFSTFSLNVTDVSFKLAAASLEQGALPDASRIRSEEFLNAFNYRDPEPVRGAPVAFAWERARYPFAHNREAIRFSVQTAARGRSALRPLNLVLLLDSSGSMERADRVGIVREALSVLAQKLEAQDRISVVAFARTARLWVDGVPGSQAREVLEGVGRLTPEGGTNLEDALNVAYETASRHFVSHGVNRVVLLTDGAANLGDVDPESLKQKVESARKKGIALDCFGIGWEGYNDDLLEVLSSHGDGRYGFVNSPEEAATGLAEQLAGALEVAASDVKVQVEFNPHRAAAWRQIGYAKHQLTKEQFRDNTVDAAELGAAESGNALYILELDPRGQGDVGTVRVRYREAASGLYREHSWRVPYTGPAPGLEESSPAMRLAVTSAAFAEWLASSPFAGEVTPDKLLGAMAGVPDAFGPDARPKQLESMIRAAKSIGGQ